LLHISSFLSRIFSAFFHLSVPLQVMAAKLFTVYLLAAAGLLEVVRAAPLTLQHQRAVNQCNKDQENVAVGLQMMSAALTDLATQLNCTAVNETAIAAANETAVAAANVTALAAANETAVAAANETAVAAANETAVAAANETAVNDPALVAQAAGAKKAKGGKKAKAAGKAAKGAKVAKAGKKAKGKGNKNIDNAGAQDANATAVVNAADVANAAGLANATAVDNSTALVNATAVDNSAALVNATDLAANATALADNTALLDNSTALLDNSTALANCSAAINNATGAMENVQNNIADAQVALDAMSEVQDPALANQVGGNLTLAMKELANMNSTNPAVESALNQTMVIMNAVMKAGKKMLQDCASA
jgi:hypothetical protein